MGWPENYRKDGAVMETTSNLKIPLILGDKPLLRKHFNEALQTIDDNALPKTHADTKAHFEMWNPNTEYKKQDIVRTSTCPSWGFYMCTVTGKSGTTEPMGYGEGDIVIDGACTWVLKPFGGASVIKHQDLQNRNLPDQHTIAAITGLQAALNTGGAAGELKQITKLGVAAGDLVEITINNTLTFKLPAVEILKFIAGAQDQVITEFSFNTSDGSSFMVDNVAADSSPYVMFDGTVHLLNTYTYQMVQAKDWTGDGQYSEDTNIDDTVFKKIESGIGA
jgi:hypothetical protein